MITYQLESVESVLEEIIPLAEEHHLEVDLYKDLIHFNPDYEGLKHLDNVGIGYLHTARDNEVLIGYTFSLVTHHLHYKDHFYSQNSLLFICPEYRHLGIAQELLRTEEQFMKELGVSVQMVNMKDNHRFETMMTELGFDKAEICYHKYIKEE